LPKNRKKEQEELQKMEFLTLEVTQRTQQCSTQREREKLKKEKNGRERVCEGFWERVDARGKELEG